MEYTQLGGSDLRVSRIAFGCEPLGGTDWGRVDEEEVTRSVAYALEVGINLFDTADVYGLGQSEERLAGALGSRRHDVVIATKFGVNWERDATNGRARTFFDSSPRHVVAAVEASLRRLRIDCIPLYQIHWPDPQTPVEDTMEALQRCREAGKIRHIGCSNFSAEQLRAAHAVYPLTTVQVGYNLLARDVERELLPAARELGLGVLVYGPLAQGLLTGKFSSASEFSADDRRSRLQHFQAGELTKNLRTVERLREVGERIGKTPAQVAIRWLLDVAPVSCAIVGIKSPRQLEENLGAIGWQLEPMQWRYLAHALGDAPIPSDPT